MLLWVIFAVLTAAALAYVLRPVLAVHDLQPEGSNADLAVYTAQLADLDRLASQGRLDPAEYDGLRHEVSRRILRLDQTATAAATASPLPATPPMAAIFAAAALPVVCLGIYTWLGNPNIPSHPFAATTASLANVPQAELIAQVEARLASQPENGPGWDMIAPIYFRMERFGDAADAYQRAVKLLGESPQRLAGFAEATVLAHDGIVTDEARTAYEKLLAANPERFDYRFWLALAKEQDGQRAAAGSEYRAMLASGPANATWRPMVEQRLAAVTGTAQPERGPTSSDVEAASALSDTERSAMIAGMVESLATRLKTNGRDAEGWQRLIQSYATLQQTGKARTALADARVALTGDTPAIAALDSLAKRLGIAP